MIALAIVFAITAIAVLAIVLAAWALGQRAKWRSIAGRRAQLRKRALHQRDSARELAVLHLVRERAMLRHAEGLYAEAFPG